MNIIIVNRRPGMIRGGRPHPPIGVYTPGEFTPEQLVEIAGEPEMVVVTGKVVHPDDVAQLLADAAEPAPAPEQTAPQKGKRGA